VAHVFISYSRDDHRYARRLVAHLRKQGVTTWMDDAIDYGTSWPDVIKTMIDNSVALVLVMTPAAQASPWVEREFTQARTTNKPIFPLLLRGRPFFGLAEVSVEDVSRRRLPSQAWVARLTALLPPPAPQPQPPQPAPRPRAPDPLELRPRPVAPPPAPAGVDPIEPEPVATQPKRTTFGRRLLILGGAAGGLALIAGAAAYELRPRPSPPTSAPPAAAKPRLVLSGHAREVWTLAFSPHRTLLASGGADHSTRLWDAGTGRVVGALNDSEGTTVYGLAFSPDGGTLTAACADGVLRLWSVAGQSLMNTFVHTKVEFGATGGFEVSAFDVAYSPDGATLASVGQDANVKLWNVGTGLVRANLPGHKGQVYRCAFHPDGLRLASAGQDGLRVWQASPAKQVAYLAAGRQLWGVTFSPDGAWLAAGGADGKLYLFDARTYGQVATLTGHLGQVWDVAFSPDSRLLASAGDDATARVWSVASRRCAALLSHPQPVYTVTIGTELATAGQDRTVRVWPRPGPDGSCL
jgi:hypothetical protein